MSFSGVSNGKIDDVRKKMSAQLLELQPDPALADKTIPEKVANELESYGLAPNR